MQSPPGMAGMTSWNSRPREQWRSLLPSRCVAKICHCHFQWGEGDDLDHSASERNGDKEELKLDGFLEICDRNGVYDGLFSIQQQILQWFPSMKSVIAPFVHSQPPLYAGRCSVNQASKTQLCQSLNCVLSSSLPCPSTVLPSPPLLAATADFHNSEG